MGKAKFKEGIEVSMKMLKHSLLAGLLLCLLAAGAIMGCMPGSVSAAIDSHEWLNTTYEGWDEFFGTSVIAYEAGSSATVIARVYNPWEKEISIDYGRLELGWTASPEEATQRPTTIGARKTALFTWRIDIPSTSNASNLLLHTYKIIIQYDVPDLVSDQKWEASGNNLAVYSEEQAACRDLIKQWNANNTSYSFWGYEARRAMADALYDYNRAASAYNSADFSQAKEYYEAAVTKQQEAMKEDAKIALTDQSALTLDGTGGVKGLGFLIGGIGILVLGVVAGLGILAWAFFKK
jgi:hypothetical protein